MTVVVGRIEYIVGANGQVLEKEARDAAKKAGRTSGKTYSDEMVESFRKRWGGASGFEKALGSYDQKVIAQFRRLGGFSSKAYATRFEKTLRPAYQATAKKMVDYFDNLTFGGSTSNLNKIFAPGPEVEGQLRRVKGLIEEIFASREMGLIDKDIVSGVQFGNLTRLRKAIEEAIQLENWELLTKEQLRQRDVLREQADAAEKVAAIQERRAKYIEADLAEKAEYQNFLMDGQLSTIERMLKDRGQFAELTDDETVSLIQQMGLWDEMSETSRKYWREQQEGWSRTADQQARFDRLFEFGGVQTKDFERLRATLESANGELDKTSFHLDHVASASKKLGPILLKPWTSLDNDVRLVIGLIASAADQVAVLGSAVGAGAFGLGTALTAALGGAVAFGVIVSRLNADIADLPANLRGAAGQLQAFKSSFSELRDALAAGGAEGFQIAFGSLRETVEALMDSTEAFGGVVGSVFAKFAQAVRPGSEALSDIQELISVTTRLLPKLADATGVWLGALVRGLGRAEPLAADLLDWIETLGIRFDQFTRTDAFGTWVRNSQRIFGEFGELLDQIGTSLNNLANPAAVGRTVELLDNLTRLVPVLEGALDVLGRLDVVGIVVEALADIGEGFGSLTDDAGHLADALRGALFPALEGIGTAISVASTVLGPFVNLLAEVVEAVPPGVWTTLAAAATTYFIALSAFKNLSAVATILTKVSDGAISLMDSLAPNKLGPASTAVDRLSDKFGKAGLAGAVLVAAAAVGQFASDAIRDLSKIEEKTLDVVASGGGIAKEYENVRGSFLTLAQPITDYGAAIDEIRQKQENFLTGADVLWSHAQRQANVLEQSFHEMDAPLAALAQKSLPEAQQQFRQMADDMGLTGAQTQVMLDEMPQLQAVFQNAAGGATGLATEAETLQYALWGTGDAAEDAALGLGGIEAVAVDAQTAIQNLADEISGFGNATLTTRDAQRGLAEAVRAAKDSVGEFGAVTDLATEGGLKNQEALDAVAGSAKDVSEALLLETGSQELANAALADGRTKFLEVADSMGIGTEEANRLADELGLVTIEQGKAAGAADAQRRALQYELEQFGLTGDEASTYIDTLNLIPGEKKTLVDILGADTSVAEIETVQRALAATKDKTAYLTIKASLQTDSLGREFLQGKGGKSISWGARGAYVDRPTVMGVGEAGPEAIVPLNRPLSMVDPAVRWLSALAQGKTMPGGSSSGGGTSRTLNIQPGAITIQGDRAPETTATLVVNRVAERLAG